MARKKKKLSSAIYLLSLFGPLFGIIFYLIFKERDEDKALKLLILSFLIPGTVFLIMVFGIGIYSAFAPHSSEVVLLDDSFLAEGGYYYLERFEVTDSPTIIDYNITSDKPVSVILYSPEKCKEVDLENKLIVEGFGLYYLGNYTEFSKRVKLNKNGVWCFAIVAENDTKVNIQVVEEPKTI